MPFALLFVLATGLTLVFTRGSYAFVYLVGFSAFIFAYVVHGLTHQQPWEAAKLRPLMLALLVIAGFFFLNSAQLMYIRSAEHLRTLARLVLAIVPLAAVLLVLERFVDRPRAKWGFVGVAALLTAVLIAARVAVLYTAPEPHIDVWTSSVKAVNYLLAGQNPYAGQYDDIYGGAYAYFPSFPYLPAYLLWASFWAVVFGGAHDVRVSLVISEALTVVPLLLLVRRLKLDSTIGWSAVVAWLALPISLFITEQAWIDPLMVMFFAFAFWALEDDRPITAGAALALACCVKQYAPIGALLALIYAWKRWGNPQRLRGAIAFAAVVVVLNGPFFALGPSAYLKSVVSAWSDQAPRTDSLSLPALMIDVRNLATVEKQKDSYLPFALMTPAILAGAAFWLWKRRAASLFDLTFAITAAYALIFLCAKQAFCNYWHFMSFFALVSAVAGCASAVGKRTAAA